MIIIKCHTFCFNLQFNKQTKKHRINTLFDILEK